MSQILYFFKQYPDLKALAKNLSILFRYLFTIRPFVIVKNKLTSVFCVCPIIDHKFRHHIVKVAVDPRGDSRVDPQTTLTM